MTATNHVLTGAAIALAIQRPLLAIPLALISHFLLDLLPQYGLGEIPEDVRDDSRSFRAIVTVDTFAALALFYIVPFLLRHHRPPIFVMLCMIAAQLPDAVWIYRHWVANRRDGYHKQHWLTRFHKWIQWGEHRLGWIFEAFWLGGVVTVLVKLAQ